MTEGLRRVLRIGLTLIALAGALAILAVAGWTVLRSAGNDPRQGARVRVPALEQGALHLYLQLRRAEIDRPAGTDPTPITFTIHPGETAVEIAQRLERAGLIGDAELFRLVIRAQGVDTRLEAGDYDLRATMTMEEIITTLQHGRPPFAVVTIPEGLRAEEIAAILSQRGLADADEFLRLVRSGSFDYPFLRDRPPGANLEGYLFPDTYQIPLGATAAQIIELMLGNFDRRVTALMRQQAVEQGLSVHGAVTLASIVEREAVVDAERPLIASVFLNRLAVGMKLDADPTVQYALGYQADTGAWWKRPLYYVDLEVESPYNTYRNVGLPPGPISNPGLAALHAVIEPAETDYYYFVANEIAGDGSHVFARTLEEHLRNLSQHRR